MTFHRIDEPAWKSFAAAFSHTHEGWTGSLEVRNPGSEPRIEVDDGMFRGAALEAHEGRETMILAFGEEPEEHFAYAIHDPRALLVNEQGRGAEATLIIEGGDGGRCKLLLMNPDREEALSGFQAVAHSA